MYNSILNMRSKLVAKKLIAIAIFIICSVVNYEHDKLLNDIRNRKFIQERAEEVVIIAEADITNLIDFLWVSAEHVSDNIQAGVGDNEVYDEYLSSIDWNTDTFFHNDNLDENLQNKYGNIIGIANEYELKQYKNEILSILDMTELYTDYYNNSSEIINNIYYISENGFLYYYPFIPTTNTNFNTIFSDIEKLDTEKTNNSNYQEMKISEIYINEEDNFAITLVLPVISKNQEDKVIGYIASEIVLNDIRELANYGDIVYYIIDDEFKVISTNDYESIHIDSYAGNIYYLYELYDTYKISNFTESIMNKQEVFEYKDNIFYSEPLLNGRFNFVMVFKNTQITRSVVMVIVSFTVMLAINIVFYFNYLKSKSKIEIIKNRLKVHKNIEKQMSNEYKAYKSTGMLTEYGLELELVNSKYDLNNINLITLELGYITRISLKNGYEDAIKEVIKFTDCLKLVDNISIVQRNYNLFVIFDKNGTESANDTISLILKKLKENDINSNDVTFSVRKYVRCNTVKMNISDCINKLYSEKELYEKK